MKTRQKSQSQDTKIDDLRIALLSWYFKNRRHLPWRYNPGEQADPYRVWLSEIMLQQTTVTAVKPYFEKFIDLWPTIHDLAKAESDEVMRQWAGLGYYSRARNLHKCARIIVNDFGGRFPNDQRTLKTLPGIGDYTSAALCTIAFNKSATVVDGNVERVISRLFAVETPLPKAKKEITTLASLFFCEKNEDFASLAQAFMDLGATICSPKSPACSICPLKANCEARVKDCQESFPVKLTKKKIPVRHGAVIIIINGSGQVLLHKRPLSGLLAGMYGFPTTEWAEKKQFELCFGKLNSYINLNENNLNSVGLITHTFTHFHLKLKIFTWKGNEDDIENLEATYIWQDIDKLQNVGFPTVFRKILPYINV